MRTFLRHILFAVAICACAALAQPAYAQHEEHDSHDHDYHGHDYGGHDYHGHDFHGRDFHAFTPGELGLWRGGRWVHGWHDGRFAWWWFASGGWYFYPVPIYPYPTYVPPAIGVQQPPPAPTGMPPSQSWYYCDNPQGYYPYVASCSAPWRPVPAAPSR